MCPSFFWVITFDLSSWGDPASSYATAGLALRIIWPHKPHHYIKVETPTGGLKILLMLKSKCNRNMYKVYTERFISFLLTLKLTPILNPTKMIV
jgi:hypothetical protein